jgi:hypothetical protein
MFSSKIIPVGHVKFPSIWTQGELYMHPIDLAQSLALPDRFNVFSEAVKTMLEHCPVKTGTAFVTIDQKTVQPGQSHRRGGPHVDGNFIFDWGNGDGGGNGWLTGGMGRYLPPEKHLLQYASPTGGLLIASSFQACSAWLGTFNGIPLQGGNCEHLVDQLKTKQKLLLQENVVYLGNSTCVHESLSVHQTVNRTLIRITLPHKEIVL